VLVTGTGTAHVSRTGAVKVQYTGWTTDGVMFDSSIPKGVPSTFRLDKVIPGWTEGIPLMVEGETRRFWIPKKLRTAVRRACPRACWSSTSSSSRSSRP
jgi:peptidylprolyl isomerase